MLEKLNINSKYLAIAGSVILLLICYQLAFKKTAEAFRTNHGLHAKLSQTYDLSVQPGYLERKGKNLNAILNRYRLDSLSLRGNTLAAISLAAEKEKVKLSEVPTDDPAFHTGQFIIERLNFEGGFTALVKVLNHLETSSDMGVPRSVTIRSVKRNNSADSVRRIGMEVLLEAGR